MNDEDELLEADLRRMQPVAPSRALMTRIGSTLEKRRWSWGWVTGFGSLAAAAVVTVLLIRRPPDEFKPVRYTNVLYETRDEGLVKLEDGTPAQRFRLRYIDTITWENPRTAASLEWSSQRDEINVRPLTYN